MCTSQAVRASCALAVRRRRVSYAGVADRVAASVSDGRRRRPADSGDAEHAAPRRGGAGASGRGGGGDAVDELQPGGQEVGEGEGAGAGAGRGVVRRPARPPQGAETTQTR